MIFRSFFVDIVNFKAETVTILIYKIHTMQDHKLNYVISPKKCLIGTDLHRTSQILHLQNGCLMYDSLEWLNVGVMLLFLARKMSTYISMTPPSHSPVFTRSKQFLFVLILYVHGVKVKKIEVPSVESKPKRKYFGSGFTLICFSNVG